MNKIIVFWLRMEDYRASDNKSCRPLVVNVFSFFLGIFIDKMNDYGAGFLMAGVALIISALFLLLLYQMNRKGTPTRTAMCTLTK